MSFYISPVVDAELVGWSFINYIPHSGKNWNGQKVYFVNYFHGIDRTDFEFYIDIKVNPALLFGWSLSNNTFLSSTAKKQFAEKFRFCISRSVHAQWWW